MPHMPTTRGGRFIFYRNRQLNRHDRMWNRSPHPPATEPGTGKHSTRRPHDWSDFTLQNARSYHFGPGYICPFNAQAAPWLVTPARGRWGVLDWTKPFDPWWAPTTNYRWAILGYRLRRIRSVPRITHIPHGPYRQPMAAVDLREFYRREFYPSGQRNPNWERLVDAGLV